MLLRRTLIGLGAALLLCAALAAVFPLAAFFLIEGIWETVGIDPHTRPPELGRDITANWPGKTPDPAWTSRLRKSFPPGTPESTLLVILRDQYFEIDEQHHSARFVWARFPCDHSLSVQWQVSRERKITTISGGTGSGCL